MYNVNEATEEETVGQILLDKNMAIQITDECK